MIEINLLPEESRVRHRKLGKISIESKYFVYLIPLAFGLLITAHVFLAVIAIAGNIQFAMLNNKWQKLKPQRELVNNLKKQYDVLAADAKLVDALSRRRINWAPKLNRLSMDLPSGIWFNEITASRKDFVLKASVVSLEKEEMVLVKRFIDNLKADTLFLKDLTGLELGSVQKRSIGSYDVVDFTLSAKLKAQ